MVDLFSSLVWYYVSRRSQVCARASRHLSPAFAYVNLKWSFCGSSVSLLKVTGMCMLRCDKREGYECERRENDLIQSKVVWKKREIRLKVCSSLWVRPGAGATHNIIAVK